MTARDIIIGIVQENSPMRGHGTNAELIADLILTVVPLADALVETGFDPGAEWTRLGMRDTEMP